MSELRFGAADARAQFDRLLGELRPRLHRFCARMTGSVVDGEDIVQEAMIKVLESFSGTEAIATSRPGYSASRTTPHSTFCVAEPASSPFSPTRAWT
jgi:hypothetical protein